MKFYIRFAFLWLVNSVILFLAASYYPTHFVLGNVAISRLTAGIFAGFLITFLCRLAKPIIGKFGLKLKGRIKMLGFYWLINSLAIWLVARLSIISGFGISAFYWAFALGIVTTLAQWAVRQAFKATGLIK